MRLPYTILGVALLVAATPLLAETPEAVYERLAGELVAPCCWQEALALHRSPAADEARADLRRMIAKGRPEAEIREAFVARYGERILIVPRGGKSDVLYWPPLVALACGLILAGMFLRRLLLRTHATPRAAAAGPIAEVDDDMDW